MALTITKLATHEKNSNQNVILQIRMKLFKFWNENVKVFKTG
jgi:hypothetical protein